jgi:hypothetical protein
VLKSALKNKQTKNTKKTNKQTNKIYHIHIIYLQIFITHVIGQSVPEDEQIDMKRSVTEETPNATPSTSMIGSITGSLGNVSEADKQAFEQEKLKLYQQLDDKVTCTEMFESYLVSIKGRILFV